MYNLKLTCLIILITGSFSQVRGNNDDRDQQDTKELVEVVIDKFENVAVEALVQKSKDVSNKIEDIFLLLEKLPSKCSIIGQKETKEIKTILNSGFDYCANLTVQLQILKKLAINGTAILTEIGVNMSQIVAELTECSLKPVYLQVGCTLKVIREIDRSIKKIVPEARQWSIEASATTQLALIDFHECYRRHYQLEKRLNEIGKEALACVKQQGYLRTQNM